MAYEKDACLGVALGSHEDTSLPIRGTTSGRNRTGHQQWGVAWCPLDAAAVARGALSPRCPTWPRRRTGCARGREKLRRSLSHAWEVAVATLRDAKPRALQACARRPRHNHRVSPLTNFASADE